MGYNKKRRWQLCVLAHRGVILAPMAVYARQGYFEEDFKDAFRHHISVGT
jgi:hypothetical protein